MSARQLSMLKVLAGSPRGIALGPLLKLAGVRRTDGLRVLRGFSTAGVASYEPEGWRLTAPGWRIARKHCPTGTAVLLGA